MLNGAFKSITAVQDEKEDVLVALANEAVVADGADVVILAGAPLSGLARKVADRIPVPVIDQVEAAVRQAETLVMLAARKATAGTFRRPDAKATLQLPESLARRIEHRDAAARQELRKRYP